MAVIKRRYLMILVAFSRHKWRLYWKNHHWAHPEYFFPFSEISTLNG